LTQVTGVRAKYFVELTNHAGELRDKIEGLPAHIAIDINLLSQLVLEIDIMVLTE